MSANKPSEIEAYSSATNTTYPNWDALIEAEANGHVAIAVLKHQRTGTIFTACFGPVPTKREATNMAVRIRNRHRKDMARGDSESELLVVNVRPAWKELA